jgi:hypothetical protein
MYASKKLTLRRVLNSVRKNERVVYLAEEPRLQTPFQHDLVPVQRIDVLVPELA